MNAMRKTCWETFLVVAASIAVACALALGVLLYQI
jgi:hypothetical protein